jgi:hypothetical protein
MSDHLDMTLMFLAFHAPVARLVALRLCYCPLQSGVALCCLVEGVLYATGHSRPSCD